MPVIHLRNGRAESHPRTRGEGVTWCGKKLLGAPEAAEIDIETFTSYGNRIHVTRDLRQGTCPHCERAFDAAYVAAFPEGLKPIATFRVDDPADMARARAVLGPEALSGFFGPGGGGMPAFYAALRSQGQDVEGEEDERAPDPD